MKPTQFDFLSPMWIERLQDFSWPVEAPRSRNVIAIIPAYLVLNSSNIHWLSQFLALAGSWCCTCLYQHAMFNKKIHPSDSCQQKYIRKWPKTTIHGVRSNKNLTSSPRFHQLRSLEPTFGLGQCREHNLFDGQFFVWWQVDRSWKQTRAHTQTSLNIISKNVSQIQDIHAFLRWQNRNHPIWRISAVEPPLVDVSNAYLYSVSAWKMHPLFNISGWKIYRPPESSDW